MVPPVTGIGVLRTFHVEDVFTRKGKPHVAGVYLGYGSTHGSYVTYPVDSLLVTPSAFTLVGSNMGWLKPGNYVTRKEGGTGTIADESGRGHNNFTFAFRIEGVGGGSGTVSIALTARPTPWGVWVGNSYIATVSVGRMADYRPATYPETFEAAGVYNTLVDERTRAMAHHFQADHIVSLEPDAAILYSTSDSVSIDSDVPEPETVEVQGPVLSRSKLITFDPF